ncbi:MAG: VWA domain-containing protein [Candidatus Korobacteraceae bacterium]
MAQSLLPRRIGFLLFTLGLLAAQEPTFRTQSNVVLVPALVRDKGGEIVYGLQAQDFVIEDDGVAQTVHLDEAAASEPVSLVVAVQCGRRADFELPRMHGLGSMLQPLMDQPETKVAVVAFDSQVHAVEDFTSNQTVITHALQGLQPGDNGAAILDAVNYSVKLLNEVPQNRKRVLLLISETRDHGSKAATIDDVIKAIGNGNVVVYTLAFSPSKSNVLDTLRGNNNPDLHPEQTEVHEGPDLLAPFLLAAQAMRKNSAKAIASLSGGEYEMFDSAKGFDSRMTDFDNHLHSRYLLSFQPVWPHPGLHQLTVRVKGRANETVVARSSYWAQASQP